MHKSENMAIFSVGVLLVVTIVSGPFFLGSAKADPYFQDPYAKDPYLDERYAPEPYGESQYPDKYSYPPGQVYSPKPDYPPGEIPVMPLAIECPITGLLVYDVDNCPQKPKECTDGYLVFDEANCRIQEEPILTPPVLDTPENEVPENEVPENEVPENEVPENEVPENEEICGDGIDNDADGLVDSEDADDCGIPEITSNNEGNTNFNPKINFVPTNIPSM